MSGVFAALLRRPAKVTKVFYEYLSTDAFQYVSFVKFSKKGLKKWLCEIMYINLKKSAQSIVEKELQYLLQITATGLCSIYILAPTPHTFVAILDDQPFCVRSLYRNSQIELKIYISRKNFAKIVNQFLKNFRANMRTEDREFFPRNGSFLSHVGHKFCLFCHKLKETSTYVNFLIFSQALILKNTK